MLAIPKPHQYWLNISRSRDLTDIRERILYRFFEILPGFLSWGTFLILFVMSWLKPVWVAVFIILFVIYWFLRTAYFSFHLRSGYFKMRQHEQIDWMNKVKSIANWRDIYHLVVFPMHKEPLELVRSTFYALLNSDYPKDRMIVVLACEEKVRDEVVLTAETIEREFGDKFYKFMTTWHPANIPGEIAGKGANESWAARAAKEKIIDINGIGYDNIIFSSFDVDTAVFPKYFSCLAHYYLTLPGAARASFQPIPLFINNIWSAPSFSRMFSFSSTFWQIMNQERPEKIITFSSHSMSFRALVDVGFKQTNIVSDDSRIFWQCFLFYDGDYRAYPVYYPVAMDANVARSFLQTLKNLYLQQRRWAYGVADIPYFLFGSVKNKRIPFGQKLALTFELIEGHWSWATAPIMIFFLGWLPLLLGGDAFSHTLLGYNLPRTVSIVLTLAMLGLISSAHLAMHMLPPKPPQYHRLKYIFLFLEWLLFPLIMIFFTAIPAIDAQTRLMLGRYMGFWPTPKTRAS